MLRTPANPSPTVYCPPSVTTPLSIPSWILRSIISSRSTLYLLPTCLPSSLTLVTCSGEPFGTSSFCVCIVAVLTLAKSLRSWILSIRFSILISAKMASGSIPDLAALRLTSYFSFMISLTACRLARLCNSLLSPTVTGLLPILGISIAAYLFLRFCSMLFIFFLNPM